MGEEEKGEEEEVEEERKYLLTGSTKIQESDRLWHIGGRKQLGDWVASKLRKHNRERQVRPIEAKAKPWTAQSTWDHMSALGRLLRVRYQ